MTKQKGNKQSALENAQYWFNRLTLTQREEFREWVEDVLCRDCGVNTDFHGEHYYALDDDLWRQVTPDNARFLCLDCLERRLGRPLAANDFVATPSEIMDRYDGGPSTPPPAA